MNFDRIFKEVLRVVVSLVLAFLTHGHKKTSNEGEGYVRKVVKVYKKGKISAFTPITV